MVGLQAQQLQVLVDLKKANKSTDYLKRKQDQRCHQQPKNL